MRRKILLIVLDQFRADVLSGGLAAFAPTPNLDGFAATATRFHNHHTVAMPCGPARASLLTGQYAMNHRSVRNGTPLAGHHPSLATAARAVGVEPLLFGYADIQPDPTGLAPQDPARRSYTAPLRGFTEVVEMREEAWRWLAHLRARGYDVPDAGAADFQRLYRPTTGALGGPALYAAEDSDTAFLTDETLKALDVRKGEAWLAFLAYIRPHPPFVAPAPYHALIDPASLPAPVAARPDHPFVDAYFSGPSAVDMYWGFDGDHAKLDDRTVAMVRAAYLGLVAEVDRHIGRVLGWLDASGLAGETLVAITADHGEMLGDHGMWGKTTPFAAASHTLLLIRDPAGGAPGDVDDLTASIDLAPTLLDWLGAPIPKTMNGASLRPYLAGGRPDRPRDAVMIEFELGDPAAPTRYETAWSLPADRCRAAVLQTADGRYAHFAGGVPPLSLTDSADPASAAALLNHRMENAAATLDP